MRDLLTSPANRSVLPVSRLEDLVLSPRLLPAPILEPYQHPAQVLAPAVPPVQAQRTSQVAQPDTALLPPLESYWLLQRLQCLPYRHWPFRL